MTATGSEGSERQVEIVRDELGRYEAVNTRGGRIELGVGTSSERFSPVELLLAGLAGCGAIDVDFITSKRSEPSDFRVTATGEKVRDADGNRLQDLRVTFEISFPDGDAGDAARAVLPDAVRRSHDRWCTVSRTVELGTPVEVELR